MHYKKNIVVHVIFLCFLLVSIISCGGSSAFKRGINYEKLKNHDAALESYRKALEEDPENSKYRLYFERARFRAAMDHFKKGKRLRCLEDALGRLIGPGIRGKRTGELLSVLFIYVCFV